MTTEQRRKNALGTPLHEPALTDLRDYVEAIGEQRALAELDVSRSTLARAMAGLGLRRASHRFIVSQLERLHYAPRIRRHTYIDAVKATPAVRVGPQPAHVCTHRERRAMLIPRDTDPIHDAVRQLARWFDGHLARLESEHGIACAECAEECT